MYDPARRWSLSFAGCGFLGFYHVGATRCLAERAPHLLRDARMLFGASSGALHCVVFLSRIPLDRTLKMLMDLVREARKRNMGPFHPSFHLSNYIRDGLRECLPDNIHQLISGKMCISLTRVSDGKNVLVSEFQSKDEVVDAVVCSCFIPFYCGMIPPSFRGERYMDGGASDNVPLLDANATITVSPFYGEHDICPKVKSTNFLHVNMANLSLRICTGNIYLLSRALFPPDVKMSAALCFQGYLDAYRFLEENGLCNRPQRGPNLPLEEMKPEVMVPSGEKRSEERAEPPDPVSLSLVTWDPGVLETFSPCLTAALSEAIRDSTGLLGRIRDLLPVRILSYALLPCTLPVESAIATVHRLVRWLPDIPEDIPWLQWAVVKLCGHLMTLPIPSSRSRTSAREQLTAHHTPECDLARL